MRGIIHMYLHLTYLKAAISVYLASRETAKKEALSRLVTITINAARDAPKAANRSTSAPILFVNFTIDRSMTIYFFILLLYGTEKNEEHNKI